MYQYLVHLCICNIACKSPIPAHGAGGVQGGGGAGLLWRGVQVRAAPLGWVLKGVSCILRVFGSGHQQHGAWGMDYTKNNKQKRGAAVRVL